MITEDFVSFEVAKLLEEKRFNEYSGGCYDGLMQFHERKCCNSDLHPNIEVAAPTLQMAMKWLREVHKIHITVYPYGEYSCDNYQFDIYKNRKYWLSKDEGYMTNEQAIEVAIKYCLENLI